MKKIIFIHLLNDYSGSPKVLAQVIKACQKNNYEAELYTGQNESGFLSNLTDKHYFYFYKRFENKYLTLITYSVSQISLFFKLLKYKNQDVIFYINTLLPFGAALAGKLLNKPVYYHIHEISLQPVVLKHFLRFIAQKTADKIIFVSQSVQQSETFLNKKQSVVFNALNDDFLSIASNHQYQWKQNGLFNVLMVCSLKAYKGIFEFIEIAKQCQKHNNICFTLILNANSAEIDVYFSKLEIPNNLRLISRQTDVIPYYQQSSLLLNLSRIDEWIETFGLTLIEAMAFGIPVIAPPVGGPTEIVTENKEGYLISSYETEKIANKILLLANDETLCLRLSSQARIRAKHFNQTTFENAILKVMCE